MRLLLGPIVALISLLELANCGAISAANLQQPLTIYHLPEWDQLAKQTGPTLIGQHEQPNPLILTTHKLLLELREQLLGRQLGFDQHFRNLLSRSKLSLHNMFIDTYGMNYASNMETFTSLYESLEQYYATGQTKLTKTMETFFEQLYQKIFQIYNTNKAFSQAYLECATEQLAHIKPFKDAPDKLIAELRHAFVAARTFNQALNTGIDVIRNLISLGQPPQCLNLINDKLLKPIGFNGSEASLLSAPRKLCRGYCDQVIKHCIGPANWEQLSNRWKIHVVSLAELAKKLSVHYNIESVIAPLDLQISEAIMNFQENAHNISEQVFQVCGHPPSNFNNDHPRVGGASVGLSQLKPVQNRLGKRWAPVPLSPAVLTNRRPPTLSYRNQQYSALASTDEFSALNMDQHNRATPSRGANYAPSGPARQPASSVARGPPAMFSHEMNPLVHAVSRPVDPKGPAIIDEIKDYILSTKLFWTNLPGAVCNQTLGLNVSFSGNNRRQQCFSEPLGLSDMNTDLNFKREIEKQVSKLDSMHFKMLSALEGNEIDWTTPNEQRQQPQQQTSNLRPLTPASGSSKAPTGNLSPLLPSGRPNFGIITSTTSTSPPPEPATDEEETDEDDQIEQGSGSSPSPLDPMHEDDDTDTTTEPDYEDEYSTPSDDEDPNGPSRQDSVTEQPSSTLDGQPPTSDWPLKPNNVTPDLSNDLITSDAQKSAGSATRFVIMIDQFRLFVMLLGFVIVSLLLPREHGILLSDRI